MVTVYFVRNGSKIPVEVQEGASLMEAAKFFSKIDIPEIPATCGGTCACGTCHVHVDDTWLAKCGKTRDNTPEIDLLEYEDDYKEGKSRLACQIYLTPEHDGLIVHLRNDELL
jgi:2Fe-2S ferredoxin